MEYPENPVSYLAVYIFSVALRMDPFGGFLHVYPQRTLYRLKRTDRRKIMKSIITSVTENALFVSAFLGVVAAFFLAAYLAEYLLRRFQRRKLPGEKTPGAGRSEKKWNIRKLTTIGLSCAISVIFMLFEFPLPFFPGFYQLDISELPILITAFAFGPVAGVMTELGKILLNLLMDGTETAFVGELANFTVGCSFLLPASVFYEISKTKKQARLALVTGTLCMTFFGTVFNAVYLLPAFARLYGWPLENIIAMGTALNPAITDMATFACLVVAPFNLLKGAFVSALTLLLYKRLSPVLKTAGRPENSRRPENKYRKSPRTRTFRQGIISRVRRARVPALPPLPRSGALPKMNDRLPDYEKKTNLKIPIDILFALLYHATNTMLQKGARLKGRKKPSA
jgi:riboflavin transporter FmnP